jgi:probable phosphoglycerate mutase
MTTFLFIRHAATSMLNRALAGRMPGSHLTRAGKEQAKYLAEQLAGVPIASIYCSPLERACETAEPLAKQLGQQIITTDEITEIEFGNWTGHSFRELMTDQKWKYFNSFRSGIRIPGGEMMLEVQARVVSCLEKLRAAYPNDIVAIVSHADVIKAAITHYAGTPVDFFQRVEIYPASVSVVAVNDYGPVILRLNGTGEISDIIANL